MLRPLTVFLALATPIVLAQAPPPAPPAAPPAPSVWTVTEGMDSPESAYFHPLIVPHLGLNRVSAYDLSDLK